MNLKAIAGLALASLLVACSSNAPTSTTQTPTKTVTQASYINNTSNNTDSEFDRSRLSAETALVSFEISQSTGMLNRLQIDRLKQLGIPTVVPNYLPEGFRVADVNAILCTASTPQRGPCREGSSYSIVYRDARNTCLFVNAIGGGVGGGSGEFQYEINTQLLGAVTIEFGKSYGGPNKPAAAQLQRPQPNLSSFPARARASAKSPYYNIEVVESNDAYGCRPNQSVSPRELEKILQSLQELN